MATDKGKHRADVPDIEDDTEGSVTERTHLLASSSGSDPTIDQTVHPLASRRTSLLARVLTWVAVFVSFAIIILAVLAAIVYSAVNRAPAVRQTPEEIVAHATHWHTSSIDVLEANEAGVRVLIKGELGIDTDWVLGLDKANSLQRAIGRWSVSRLGGATVEPASISIFDAHSAFLLNITTSMLNIPLQPNAAGGTVRASPMEIPLLISPTNNSKRLAKFAENSWVSGIIRFHLRIPSLFIRSARHPWWMPKLELAERDVLVKGSFDVPPTPPGFPRPGRPFLVADILQLEEYSVEIRDNSTSIPIGFAATAKLLLPFDTSSTMHLPTSPPSFTFLVSLTLPNNTEYFSFATLSTTPSVGETRGLASLIFPIQGDVLPIQTETVPALSHLVSNYLSALPSTIVISSVPSPSFPLSLPPTRATFPGPNVRPKILRDVKIKDMKLTASPSGEELVASGTLFASFALPDEVSSLTSSLDIRRIWPDTLIFNGPPPPIPLPPANASSFEIITPYLRPAPPLPDPLPERAFARIRSVDWLDAWMLPPDDDTSSNTTRKVTAKIVDAPLDVLPGRDAEFRSFLRKVLMSGGAGALAGVRGTSAIAVRIEGLSLPPRSPDDPNEEQDIELDGLSFEGSVVVGRRNFVSLGTGLLAVHLDE